MPQQFFEDPILNPPYERPTRHGELGPSGQPTTIIKVIDHLGDEVMKVLGV